jgi:hypothetical protein
LVCDNAHLSQLKSRTKAAGFADDVVAYQNHIVDKKKKAYEYSLPPR